MSLHAKLRVRSAVGLATTVLLAACSDAPNAPVAAPAAPASFLATPNAGARRATRVPNAVRYRDNGLHPHGNRSGSASLWARAFIDRAGVATLDLSTADFDAPSAPGVITRAQIKRYAPNGKLVGTTNVDGQGGGTASYALTGVARGSRIVVQANVKLIDGNRNDVVTDTVAVALRPDLAVVAVDVRKATLVGQPTTVTALISERNGDAGARGDCVLYVNGARADAAPHIWVDAGDVVSCAFSPRFATRQRATVAVVIEATSPGDYDVANNSDSTSVDVLAQNDSTIAYFAQATDESDSYRDSTYTRISTPAGSAIWEGWSSTVATSRLQSADFGGTLPNVVLAWPVERLELSQSTGGVIVHAAVLENLAPTIRTPISECAGGDLEGGQSFSVCSVTSPGGTSAYIAYSRRAGTATYLSQYYARDWYQDGTVAGDYFVNIPPQSATNAAGASIWRFGSDYRFDVRLTTAGAAYGRSVVFPVSSFSRIAWQSPWTCGGSTSVDATRSDCIGSSMTASGLSTGYHWGGFDYFYWANGGS